MANYGIEGETYNIVNGKPKYSDYVMKNPNGLAPLPAARSTGTRVDILEYLFVESYVDLFDTEKQHKHIVKFQPLAELFPNVIATAEESRVVSSATPEINTYVQEMMVRFITNKEPFSNFDRYVQTVKGMGIDKVIEVKQAQYDRYKKAMN